MAKQFVLYGASGHGKVILDTLEECEFSVRYFVDDNPSLTRVEGIPVVKSTNIEVQPEQYLIISIGDNKIRKRVAEQLSGFSFGTAVHPKSNLSKKIKVEEGTVIMAGVTVNTSVEIGKHVILNTNASIDHDCMISDFVHVSPNATLCGNVTIGEGAHIGAGATIIPGVKIGKWATVGAGAVVIRNVDDGSTVAGNPAKNIFKT